MPVNTKRSAQYRLMCCVGRLQRTQHLQPTSIYGHLANVCAREGVAGIRHAVRLRSPYLDMHMVCSRHHGSRLHSATAAGNLVGLMRASWQNQNKPPLAHRMRRAHGSKAEVREHPCLLMRGTPKAAV